MARMQNTTKDALTHQSRSPQTSRSSVPITRRTSSANKTTSSRTRRDSMFDPPPTPSKVSWNSGSSNSARSSKKVHFTPPTSPTPATRLFTPKPTAADIATFDDICLTLARSPPIQQILHTTSTKTSPTPISLATLTSCSPLYRSLSISDPKLTGHPIRFRSRHFSLSPRGLRVGDCEFLNLPTPGDGINLTTRPGVDGRPCFVVEYVATLCDVETGKGVWVMAGQTDVTEVVRDMARMTMQQRAHESLTMKPLAVKELKAKMAKEKVLVFPDQLTALSDVKYFSSSEESGSEDGDGWSDTDTTFSDSPIRKSLGSMPNRPFVYHSPPKSHVMTADAAKLTRQAFSSLDEPTTLAVENEEAAENEKLEDPDDSDDDVFVSLAKEMKSPDTYSRPTSTAPRSTIAPSNTLTIPTSALITFSSTISTLRTLHERCIVLNRTKESWRIAYTTPTLLSQPKDITAAFKHSPRQTQQTLLASLERDREVRMMVKWGEQGKAMWIYAVPMVRAVGVSEKERCWMGFLVEGVVGDMWGME